MRYDKIHNNIHKYLTTYYNHLVCKPQQQQLMALNLLFLNLLISPQLIRVHSMAAGAVVKGEGKPNDLLERIRDDSAFAAVHDKLDTLIDPKLFIGRSSEQVTDFIQENIKPILEKYVELLKVENKDAVTV